MLGSLQESRKINLNTQGDEHLSFSASHLALSPNGKYLLISTDTPRIIMYKLSGGEDDSNGGGAPRCHLYCDCCSLLSPIAQDDQLHRPRPAHSRGTSSWPHRRRKLLIADLSCTPLARSQLHLPQVHHVCSADFTQARNFFGLQIEDKFHQPCAVWHRSGHYIIAAAAGQAFVFHVGTTKVGQLSTCTVTCLAQDRALSRAAVAVGSLKCLAGTGLCVHCLRYSGCCRLWPS